MKSVIKKEIRPHSFAAWMAFMRPKTFWIAAAPVCVGTAFAGALAGTWNLWIFLFTLLGAVSIQAMSNMVNDYAYNLKKAENGTRVGLPRATTEGWISMSAAKKMVGFSIVVCSLFGILLIVIGGLPIACIAVLSLICGFCYMGGPKPIAYTPFGEFLVLVFYGLFAVSGTYWLQTHSFNWLTLVPGLSLGLIGAAVLFVNNYRDLDHDRSVGRYTLVAACGRKLANTLYMLMIFLPTAQAAQPLESGTPMTLTTPSAILAETATGTVIFEKNADERREVASITKLMTALLVLEALDRDEIALTDSVQISPRAAAMKGSQALLDANAVYPLEDLLRTTIMASANDSAVALSEYIAGSEENFVDRMNRRAAELGMTNTNYVNCTGYPQSGQYTTARDVCRLCCEIAKHPRYNQYASVWIDKLTHPSGRVTDLTNTNRLVRFYEGCDGYKTGSTDAAKYCLAATAEKNGMRLVAIVLGTPVSQTRFNEARQMLDYGFATYRRVVIANKGDLLGQNVEVRGGSAESVPLALGSGLSMLLKNGQQSGLSLSVQLPESVDAPIAQGDVIGLVDVLLDGQVIAKLNCVAAEDVPRPGFIEGLLRILRNWR